MHVSKNKLGGLMVSQFLLKLLFCSIFLWLIEFLSNPVSAQTKFNNTIITRSQPFNDTEVTYNDSEFQRDSSMWVLQVGYFPRYSGIASSGYLFSLQFEKQSNRLFNRGWYVILKQTFETRSVEWKGGLSIGPFLIVERFGFFENYMMIKFGAGVIMSSFYGAFTSVLSLEYEKTIDDNLALSITLMQEVFQFRYFFPLQIGLAIKF